MDLKSSPVDMPPPYNAYGFNQTTTLGHQPNTCGSTLDNLNNVLGFNEKLFFVSTSRIGFSSSALVVQLQNPSGQVVMSTLHNAGHNLSTQGRDNTIRVGGITTFLDTTGRTLLTSQENGRSLTVSSGDMMLGVVEGFGIFSQNIVAKNVLGQIVLRVVQSNEMGSRQFQFLMANEMEIGKFEMSQQGQIVLSFSCNLDAQTKGLLLSTAYMLYLHYFVVTIFGTGQRRIFRRFCYCSLFAFFLFFAIFLTIFLITFFTVRNT